MAQFGASGNMASHAAAFRQRKAECRMAYFRENAAQAFSSPSQIKQSPIP
jgi:hypothetical protein